MKKTIALMFVAASIFSASPAFAHDEVLGTYPESGTTVEAGAIDLNIAFGEEVLTTQGTDGFEVAVTDAKGATQEIGCLSPLGSNLSARTAIATPGEYTVAWRSVSSDGHPAEGSYKFTVENTTGYELNKDDVLACPKTVIAPEPLDDPSAIAYSTGPVANNNTVTEIGLLIVLVILVGGAAVWVTRRKKSKN